MEPLGKYFPTLPLNTMETLLDIKIRPFSIEKEQLHLLFQCYLPMYRCLCRFKSFSYTNFFIIGGGRPPPCPPGYASGGDFYGTVDTLTENVRYAIVNVVLIIVASMLSISIIVLIKARPMLDQPSFIFLAALACSNLAMVWISITLYVAIALRGVSQDGTIERALLLLASC